MGTVTRDPGSFRDPAGYVLHYGGAVYRSLDREAFDRLGTFLADPVYRRLSANGDLLPVAVADAGEREELARLERRDDRWYVRQRRLPFISYPYEWSPRMLHAAALCTLRIEAALIDRGFTLKDASAYNIQFDLTDRGPAPVFIDITSIEAAPPRPLWMAHHQFLRHFALPLILYRQFGYDYRGDFLADLEGVHPDSVYRIAGRLRRWLPPYLFLVTVPHLLRNLESDGTAEIDRRAAVPAHHHAERDRYILSRLVRRLERLIKRLEPPARASQWTGYEADNSYPPPAAARKEEFVARACATLKPARLINLGCNLGKFDLIAADHGIEVIALDLDLASIDTVYQRARERHARIIPLRIDLAAPEPGDRLEESRTPLIPRARLPLRLCNGAGGRASPVDHESDSARRDRGPDRAAEHPPRCPGVGRPHRFDVPTAGARQPGFIRRSDYRGAGARVRRALPHH